MCCIFALLNRILRCDCYWYSLTPISSRLVKTAFRLVSDCYCLMLLLHFVEPVIGILGLPSWNGVSSHSRLPLSHLQSDSLIRPLRRQFHLILVSLCLIGLSRLKSQNTSPSHSYLTLSYGQSRLQHVTRLRLVSLYLTRNRIVHSQVLEQNFVSFPRAFKILSFLVSSIS